jgi:1-aminocyclopropane-1-carboxylate deaminase
MLEIKQTPTQTLNSSFLDKKGIQVLVKRDDLNHPLVMGNKWRKLKYNLQYAHKHHYQELVTFGGAFSNHILATAAACSLEGLRSVGIIRGDELNGYSNPTLAHAHRLGMKFVFVSREEFRSLKNDLTLPKNYVDPEDNEKYILPEGGTNAWAIKGCSEILSEVIEDFDICCTAMGTGGTFLGLLESAQSSKKIWGFSALKGSWIEQETLRLKQVYDISNDNYRVFQDEIFGGYGRFDQNLIQFILDFRQEYDILLDPIYTGKMFFRVWDMIKNDQIAKGTTLLLVHTGGLQGIAGFNFRFGQQLPQP